MNQKPLVSICCLVYNHEKYIVDCLEGIINQKTSFPYEVIIHDDASTDNSVSIIKEYEKKYPGICHCIYQETNQFKYQNTLVNCVFPKTRGKYIAICEGDDYWTDLYKLESQVSFLEANPEFVLSCHNAIILNENGTILSHSKLPENCRRDFTGEELIKGALILTLTICVRNFTKNIPSEIHKVPNGDTFLISYFGQFGGAKYQDSINPAVYRVHSKGIWSSLPDKYRNIKQLKTYYHIYKYHHRIKTSSHIVDVLYERFFNKKVEVAKESHRAGEISFFRSILSLFLVSLINRRLMDSYRAIKIMIKFYKS